MNPIAVFYHCRLSGGSPEIKLPHASAIMAQQMFALTESGLARSAKEIHIGCNGEDDDVAVARMLAPSGSNVVAHGPNSAGEFPTLRYLIGWLPQHQGWHVFYHHSKCATRTDPLCEAWRFCMELATVWNWRRCVGDLKVADSVGAHWMTPEKFGDRVKAPYWGGNFWWARSEFLSTLPPLPERERNSAEHWLCEGWIGHGPRRPTVVDYAPHWPNLLDCSRTR